MREFSFIRKLILVIGDVLIMAFSLWLALWLRFGELSVSRYLEHLQIFGYLFVLWGIVFYLNNLYRLSDIIRLNKLLVNLFRAIVIAAFLSIIIFYILPNLHLAPKTILLMFSAVTYVFIFDWRIIFVRIFRADKYKNKVLIIGGSNLANQLAADIQKNQKWGYQLVGHIKNIAEISDAQKTLFKNTTNFVGYLKENKINMVVAQFDDIKNKTLVKNLSGAIESGTSVMNAPIFYEKLTSRVAASELDQFWFLYSIDESEKRIYRIIKRFFDIIIGVAALPIFLVFVPIVWILMKAMSDRGRLFYTQKRVGIFGKVFTIYKFRTMADAKADKASWTSERDMRITPLGKFLRLTRIDELPQMINILKGEMSFIGPRPEQPEIVKRLEEEIPFYNRRHIVRPGLTGWAQVEYRYGSSVEDAVVKLEYDLYYIKNRSIFLDLAIVLKTIVIILGFRGR